MTVTDNTLIEVQNITDHTVIYHSADGKRRSFPAQAIAKIPAEELRSLHYTKGGYYLLHNALSVKNRELATEFGISSDVFEHEYNWTEKNVETVLLYGSLDAVKDALDFAPAGIIDMMISKAVELRINDIAKRDAITKATGRDITKMIDNIMQSEKDNEPAAAEAPKTRRVNNTATSEEKTRRVAD